jgi:hypothetical protein
MNPAAEALKAKARAVRIEDEVARRGIKLLGKIDRSGKCPRCGGDDRFSINTKKQTWNCRGCKTDAVTGDIIGLVEWLDEVDYVRAVETLTGERQPIAKTNGYHAGPVGPEPTQKREIVEVYPYHDADTALRYEVCRQEWTEDGKRKKSFLQRRPNGGIVDGKPRDGWVWGLSEGLYLRGRNGDFYIATEERLRDWKGAERIELEAVAPILYRLPELREEMAQDPNERRPIMLAEGERDVHTLVAWNCCATTNSGGAANWTDEHAAELVGADVVILVDNDAAGRDRTANTCRSLVGKAKSIKVLRWPEHWPDCPKGGDVTDWRDAAGGTADRFFAIIDKLPEWTPGDGQEQQTETNGLDVDDDEPRRASRFKIEMLDDIVLPDDPVELIAGMAPMGPALGIVSGPPKSFKSFLLIHVGLHIATDTPYCCRAVQGGGVIYITSEGIRGVRRRLVAGRRAMGIEGKKVPFALIPAMPNLATGETDRAELQKEITDNLAKFGVPLRLIVIDTMRRAISGKSENEQKDMSILIDNCEALARAFDCLVVLIHHSPRSDDQRGSGSNALDGAADMMWSVIRPDDTKLTANATVARTKDGEEGDTWTFELRVVEVGTDRDGNPIMSCSVEVTVEPERKTTKKREKKPPSPLGAKFLQALQDVFAAGATVPYQNWKAVKLDLWRAESERMNLLEKSDQKDAKRRADVSFHKHKRELIERDHIVVDNDVAWLKPA